MNFEDIKDQLKNSFKTSWEKIQESSAYNKIKDRYDGLTPNKQKLVLLGTSAIVSFIILSIPYGQYSTSTDSVTEFEDRRGLIRELLKVHKEAGEVPQINPPPSGAEVKSSIDGFFKSAGLLPEQIGGIENAQAQTKLFQSQLIQEAFSVKLKKLNLRQIIDLGYQLQSINIGIKLKDMNIEANVQDPRYLDAQYTLVSLKVPESIPEPTPEPVEKNNKKRKKIKGDTEE